MKEFKDYFSKSEIVLWSSSVMVIIISFCVFDRINYMTLCASLIGVWILASLYDIRYVSVVVCFIAFFANDIYGFVSWRKMKTRQQEITNVVSIM